MGISGGSYFAHAEGFGARYMARTARRMRPLHALPLEHAAIPRLAHKSIGRPLND